MDIYFFDIPIYRLPKEKYYKERDDYLKKNIYSGSKEHNEIKKQLYEKCPQQEAYIKSHLIQKYGGAWNYNEIIGWIKLHFLGNQIRGEFWYVIAKKICLTRKKIFEWKDWKLAPEIEIPDDADNKKIFSLIKEYISDCKKEKELKNRYVDTSLIDTIGPYIDWRSLYS